MTQNSKLKRLVRERMAVTGEKYTVALRAVQAAPPMRVLKIDQQRLEDLHDDLREQVRDADVVVNVDGVVVKDRHGVAPRPATPAELSQAKTSFTA